MCSTLQIMPISKVLENIAEFDASRYLLLNISCVPTTSSSCTCNTNWNKIWWENIRNMDCS